MNMHVPALQRSLSDVVAEYDQKAKQLTDALKTFEQAGADLKMAATIGGTFGQENIETGRVYESSLRANLLKSAWLHVYEDIKVLATPSEKRLFDQALRDLPPFTIENIGATFGKYYLDPRGHILRGLAEVFCDLDQAYKSHEKVKIGVAGLPKRIILSNVGSWGSWGRDRLIAVMNALASYQGKPLVEHKDLEQLDALHRWDGHRAGVVEMNYTVKNYLDEDQVYSRGLTVKKFMNGNAHVMFDADTLRDINRALAEFYGDALANDAEQKPATKQASTEVAKDLQYYPTPQKVVDDVLDRVYVSGKKVLEPSCGCGRFLTALRAKGALPYGVEFDAGRVAQCRAQGFKVLHANFLQTVPDPKFDLVVMNPPFYGRHYAKHVEHALKFLVPGGTLHAILPVTARYDHGLLDHHGGTWQDLPVGSFSESGTNINTTTLTIRTKE